jgi:uncharacterized protein YbbC (DUF1343 family)
MKFGLTKPQTILGAPWVSSMKDYQIFQSEAMLDDWPIAASYKQYASM